MQIRLSETSSVAIKMPLKGRDGQRVEAVLSQQEFEQLSADLFRRARLPLDQACWQVCISRHAMHCFQKFCVFHVQSDATPTPL